MSGRYITIRRQDCALSIARANGLPLSALWEHSDNDELRDIRASPFHLKQGDRLFVPTPVTRTLELATSQQHEVRIEFEPIFLRVQFLLNAEPRASAEFRIAYRDEEHTGTTDGDGMLEWQLPHTVSTVEVRFASEQERPTREGWLMPEDFLDDYEPPEESSEPEAAPPDDVFVIDIGALDPVNTIAGAQDRLSNLGFTIGDRRGELGPWTKQALRIFQARHDVELTEELDDATQAKLAEVYDDQ